MFLKARIWTDPMQSDYHITFYYEREDKLFIAKQVTLEFQEHASNELIPATITVGRKDIRTGFFQSLINELTSLGFKPKSESFLEGELNATKYHLEDLRILLKFKK